MQYNTILYYMLLYYMQYNTIPYYMLYYTTLYYTIPRLSWSAPINVL